MTKREAAWLIVRLVGFYFIWQSIESTALLVYTIKATTGAGFVMAAASGVLTPLLLKAVFYAILGLYLIGDGRLFFHLLNSAPDE